MSDFTSIVADFRNGGGQELTNRSYEPKADAPAW